MRTVALVASLVVTSSSLLGDAADGPRFGHVERAGRGGPVLVLVPCLGCDWRAWDELMARNSERFTMVAVTWPGMGKTPMPGVDGRAGDTPLHDYLDDALLQLIRDEKLVQPILVGHSAAAPWLVRFAARHEELVGGVVSVDATITNWDTFGFSRAERLAWAENEMDDVLDRYDDDRAWAELNQPPKLPSEERSRFYGEMWMTPPRQHVLAYWSEWLRIDSGSLIGSFRLPLLAVYAIRSSDENPEQSKRERLARFERAKAPENVRVEFIPGSGHSIWEWQPEAFDLTLARFVESLGTATKGGLSPDD